MNWLALALYALGLIGGAASVNRDVPAVFREWAILIVWPLAVAVATLSGLFQYIRSGVRP